MVLTPSDMVTAGAVLLAVVATLTAASFRCVSTPGSRRRTTCKRRFEPGMPMPHVLVILGLVIMILTSTDGVLDKAQQLSAGVLYAAILMPHGILPLSHRQGPGKAEPLSSCCGLGPLSLSPSAWSRPEWA